MGKRKDIVVTYTQIAGSSLQDQESGLMNALPCVPQYRHMIFREGSCLEELQIGEAIPSSRH